MPPRATMASTTICKGFCSSGSWYKYLHTKRNVSIPMLATVVKHCKINLVTYVKSSSFFYWNIDKERGDRELGEEIKRSTLTKILAEFLAAARLVLGWFRGRGTTNKPSSIVDRRMDGSPWGQKNKTADDRTAWSSSLVVESNFHRENETRAPWIYSGHHEFRTGPSRRPVLRRGCSPTR